MKMTRQIVLIWFVWSVLIVAYMQFVSNVILPDRLEAIYELSNPFLREPFLNSQAAWDSNYYLGIATAGYEDTSSNIIYNPDRSESYSVNYSFFPLYPYLIGLVHLPFQLLGLNPLAAATLAGVIISLLGTLAAALALYDLLREHLKHSEPLLMVFLFLIFPSAFFFSAVYSEGLFAGFAFGSLAMMRRKQWIWAGILAALATWTRSIGVGLFLSLLITWAMAYRRSDDKRALLPYLPFVFAPVIAYGLWYLALGYEFNFVQRYGFRNELFNIPAAVQSWQTALNNNQERPVVLFQLLFSLGAVLVALISCFIHLRKLPYLAIFGIFALMIPITSGAASASSAIRYVLVVPTFWLSLVLWSRNKVFKLTWLVVSALLVALYAFLFSVDIWAG